MFARPIRNNKMLALAGTASALQTTYILSLLYNGSPLALSKVPLSLTNLSKLALATSSIIVLAVALTPLCVWLERKCKSPYNGLNGRVGPVYAYTARDLTIIGAVAVSAIGQMVIFSSLVHDGIKTTPVLGLSLAVLTTLLVALCTAQELFTTPEVPKSTVKGKVVEHPQPYTYRL